MTSKVMMTREHWEDDNENEANSAENSFLSTEVDFSINSLNKQFENLLLNIHFQISSLKVEYKSLRDYIKENYKTENMDYIVITRKLTFLRLPKLCLTFAVANAKSETAFSHKSKKQ